MGAARTMRMMRWVRKVLSHFHNSSLFGLGSESSSLSLLRTFTVIEKTYQVVVAALWNMGIGKDGKLSWMLRPNLKFFKEVTMATSDPVKKNTVVMENVVIFVEAWLRLWNCCSLFLLFVNRESVRYRRWPDIKVRFCLSVMSLKSDGSLCIMEALNRSQPEGMVPTSSPKLENFLGGATMGSHQYGSKQTTYCFFMGVRGVSRL
ncbi:hypothetical protein HHK36_025209 [Tetracentron sinense]|uniref:dihydrofolate reductase n=1 Tax=Tetracentron sinense TaxID=13715 RepID=A0A834YRG0_TETSI|nr:hypothetical protein HHK36_025209 [Tetracentron sinense]